MLNNWSPSLCGQYAMVAYCESGEERVVRGKFRGQVWKSNHEFAKILHCNREWCPTCGADWSDSHKQKFARWLPKLQKLGLAGYLVITVPMGKRGELRDIAKLRAIRRSIIRGLKYRGYERGLSRWHWFGDKCPGLWYPHLNIILDRGRLTPSELADIKAMAAKILGVPMAVCYYHYTRSPSRIVHWGKYITRATFLDWTWDSDMADSLYRFHNCHSWGDWDSLADSWYLPPSQSQLADLSKLEAGVCPICGGKLNWYRLPDKTDWLRSVGFVDYVAGWLYRCNSP
jgi:hypothetical protein